MKDISVEDLEKIDGGGVIYDFFFGVGYALGKGAAAYGKGVERGTLPYMYMP